VEHDLVSSPPMGSGAGSILVATNRDLAAEV